MDSPRDEEPPEVEGFLRLFTTGVRRARVDWGKDTQFSEAWYWVIIIVTLLGLVMRRDDLMLLAAMLLTVAGVSWFWSKVAFVGLSYRRRFGETRAFLGETVGLDLVVENRKLLPLPWLRLDDVFPRQLPLEGGKVVFSGATQRGQLSLFFFLRWNRMVTHHYRIHCTQRGYFSFGPARMETGDPFGLFRQERRLKSRDWLIVYPKMLPLTELGLPAKGPFGDVKSGLPLFQEPSRPMGVRDYSSGDRMRDIHWKATAHCGRLQTKVYEPATHHSLVVFLNVATLAQAWRGTIPERLERVVTIAASVCGYGAERRWQVGLYANGALPESDQPIKVQPGRSPNHLVVILEQLAAVTPFATAPIEEMLLRESTRLPWGATLVLVTAIVTEPQVAALQRLRSSGRPVVLLALEDTPLPDGLEGIRTYLIPPGDVLRPEMAEEAA